MTIPLSEIFKYFILFTTVGSILVFTSLGDLPRIFWWPLNASILILAIILKPYYHNKQIDDTPLLFIKLFLIWNAITITRGLFIAENYWEWKNLIDSALILLMPLLVFVFINENFTKKVLSNWFKYMLILVFLFIPFITANDFLGRYLPPVMLLLMIFPILPFKWKLITLFMTLLVITGGFDARSNVIRFSIATIFGMFYYFRFLYIDKFFKTMHLIMIILPITLLLLALTNTFNIFKMDEYIKGDYTTSSKAGESESLTADTRTLIYVETIMSSLNNNYVIEGRTPARGYDSDLFGDFLQFELGTGKRERFTSEVSILNIYSWGGLIAVFLYFFIFLYSSYLAIYKSNNYFIKVIGLFIAFRWAYAFIEDFTKFDIQYVLLWILISMCLSSNFRKMNDEQFKDWTQDLLRNSILIKIR